MRQRQIQQQTTALHGLLVDRISITQAAESLGVCPATVARWVKVGAKGIRLETFVLGARRFTSQQLLERFIAATNETNGLNSEPTALPRDQLAKPGPLEDSEAVST